MTVYVLIVTLLATPAYFDGNQRSLQERLVEVNRHAYASVSLQKVHDALHDYQAIAKDFGGTLEYEIREANGARGTYQVIEQSPKVRHYDMLPESSDPNRGTR